MSEEQRKTGRTCILSVGMSENVHHTRSYNITRALVPAGPSYLACAPPAFGGFATLLPARELRSVRAVGPTAPPVLYSHLAPVFT